MLTFKNVLSFPTDFSNASRLIRVQWQQSLTAGLQIAGIQRHGKGQGKADKCKPWGKAIPTASPDVGAHNGPLSSSCLSPQCMSVPRPHSVLCYPEQTYIPLKETFYFTLIYGKIAITFQIARNYHSESICIQHPCISAFTFTEKQKCENLNDSKFKAFISLGTLKADLLSHGLKLQV